MAPGFSGELVPHTYTRDEDLPFMPHGNDAFISGNVERVKRTSGSGDSLLYARKTLTIDEQRKDYLEDAKRRLLQEANALRRARHGHVIEIIDTYFFDREQDTRFSIVMECADTNLDAYLTGKTSRSKTNRLVGWFGCLVSVITYVHGLGIRHRDIKPSNILVKDGRILLADFGISKMGIGNTMPTTIPELARSRTPEYCAPEIEHGSTRGRSADIFSLGAVFLEMLVAYSYPIKRQALETTLTSKGNRYRSYAKSLDHIHQFMETIEEELRPEKWFLTVLSYTREMLHAERDQRPLADTLNRVWWNLQSSDLPLIPCACPSDIYLSGNNKLLELCKAGSLEQVEIDLANGQDPNTLGAIHQASVYGHIRIVQSFLDHGANVNLEDYSGQTTLHCAARQGHKDIVEMLLENGADVQLKDNDWQTALHYAAGQGHHSIVELLLSEKADIQATNTEGQTALHLAARREQVDMVRTLLNGGANPEIMDANGRTALHFAAGYGSENVVGVLMKIVRRGIVDTQDVNGQTALDFAARGTHERAQKYEAVKKMLLEFPDAQGELPDSQADRKAARQALIDDTRIENKESEAANSDSGYASGTYRSWNATYTFAESNLAEIAEASESQEYIGLGCRGDAAEPPNIGLYDKDTAYSPSETPSLQPLRNQVYIDDLASQLFKTVVSQKPDRATLNRVSQELPDLLRAFSLKIGYRATPIQCHVAYFLHKYRRHVQQSFENMFPLLSVSKVGAESPDTEDYKIARFFEGLDLAVDPPQEDDAGYQDLRLAAADRPSSAVSDHSDSTEDDVEPPEPISYQDSVLNSAAFDWLVTTVLTEVNLTRQAADVMWSIRSQILGTLPTPHEVSRKKSSREYRARFEIDWDPLAFVKDQKYQESPDLAIERSITLTGSLEDAQALTTGQYLAQTWPASGAEVMRLVVEVMRNADHRASITLLDGTELRTRIYGGKFTVHATGIGDSLAEVAQQFAWLGAALRSSPFDSGIAICSPTIRNQSLENITLQGQSSDLEEPYVDISCVIEFDIQEPLSDAQRKTGHCWHSMFRNPVMVKGYPIMAKHNSGLGVEMPLNIMSRLIGSNYANEFDGKTFIKGFSAMLIATEVSKDLILWHYYFNVAGERVSYLDHNLDVVEAVSLQQLDAGRHVVGWCRECDSYAGAANVQYGNISSIYLPEPHADCILEKISLSSGQLISGGVSVAVGVHHITPHLTRDSYHGKLTWIATRFVVFWDEVEKRGWLVNGTSALLHLVRASIQHHSSGEFSALVTFDPSKIKYPAELKPDSASQVLSNPENLEVEVLLDKIEKIDEYEPVQDSNGASMPIYRK